MHLPGRLSASTLGDLLGALHRERVTGLLELSEVRGPRGRSVPGRIHRIHLRGGLVVAVESALGADLRERLEALFAIEEATLAFRTARPLAAQPMLLLPRDFLHGRPRARDRGRTGATPRGRSADETPPPRSGVRSTPEDARDRARKLLGICGDVGLGDVRRAFRRVAGALHPDRLGDLAPEEQRRRAARFAELSAAYHLLVA